MIRAALGSLITRRVTPPPAESVPPLFRPKEPAFTVRRQSEPYIHSGTGVVQKYCLEHGASLNLFLEVWNTNWTMAPALRTALVRAMEQYMDDNGPIGEGLVVIQAGKAWTGSFRIRENKSGTVLVLRLVGYGPDEEVPDWSTLDTVTLAQQLR